jgi:hypothetical protein
MQRVKLTTGSGIVKGEVDLVSISEPVLRRTHNGDTWFKYQTGEDSRGVRYETKPRGGGWRRVK